MFIIYFQIFDVSFLRVSNMIAEYYLYNNIIRECTFLFGISRDRLDTLSILLLHSRKKKKRYLPPGWRIIREGFRQTIIKNI